MSMTDPIADFLTRIRNALGARHATVRMDGSRMKQELARILVEEGYIESWHVTRAGAKSEIELKLKYVSEERAIRGLERVSRPGRRIYRSSRDIPKVLNGLGISIVSTSKGIVSGDTARSLHVGGEILCKVW